MQNYMSLQLRSARALCALSQSTVAADLGLQQSTVARAEAGDRVRKSTILTLKLYYESLGISFLGVGETCTSPTTCFTESAFAAKQNKTPPSD